MDERASPNLRRLRRMLAVSDLGCPRCGYNLRGSRGEVCPECGRTLNLAMFTTRPAPVTRAYRAAQGGALLAAAIGLGHLGVYAPRHARLGEWSAVCAMAATALAGLAAAVVWMASRRRILGWPQHKQARAATAVWVVAGVVLLVAVAT